MSQQIYARVEDGVIKEHYVTKEIINNRSHPMELSETHKYVPIVRGVVPQVEWDEVLEEEYVFLGSVVTVNYKVVKASIQSQLNYIFSTFGEDVIEDGEVVGRTLNIANVDPEVASRFTFNLGNHAMDKLEAFCKRRDLDRNYDGIVSCLSYKSGVNTMFAADAAKVEAYRDEIWSILLAKQTEIMSGTLPLPSSESEIDAWLPEFSWD
jgi:hypothetical protein